jgi:hypothetical protein
MQQAEGHGRDKYLNGELRPVVDRQLRTPEEMAAVSGRLGRIAAEVNVLLEGFAFDDRLYELSAFEQPLPSGLLISIGFGLDITLRPAAESSLSISLTRKPYYVLKGERHSYVDMVLKDGSAESYGFWLQLSDQGVTAEPDTFTGLDDEQLVSVERLIERIKDCLPSREDDQRATS